MTNIVLKKENGSIISFEASGHSGFGCEGSDIVCAALSSVIWATINGLENVVGISIEYSENDGFVSCRIPKLSKKEREKADILLDSMAGFLYNLAESYSEYITVAEV